MPPLSAQLERPEIKSLAVVLSQKGIPDNTREQQHLKISSIAPFRLPVAVRWGAHSLFRAACSAAAIRPQVTLPAAPVLLQTTVGKTSKQHSSVYHVVVGTREVPREGGVCRQRWTLHNKMNNRRST